MNSEFKVLVVEDMSNDFEMLKRTLRRTGLFELTWTRSAGEGLAELGNHQYDVVLLDLTLPDSKGLDSVDAFTESGTTPVVVLSGLDDENTALESVQHGAHDYLVKGKFDSPLISRTLRYAIERFRLMQELRQAQLQVRRERELRRLKSDAISQSKVGVLSTVAPKPLKATNADFFAKTVTQYSDLIDKALELRDFKIEYNVSATLRALADALGVHRASPRDVIEVHTLSVNAKLEGMSARRSSLCNDEARYLLTGLLGHLCMFYQSHATAPESSTNVSKTHRTVSEGG